MTSNTEYRYATREDLIAYYKDDPLYFSSRAVVIVKEGEVVGVGGVCRADKQMVVFTDIQKDRVTTKDIVKASKIMLEIINRYSTVIAFIDGETETALSFGTHYGFKPTGVVTDEGAIFMKVTDKWIK